MCLPRTGIDSLPQYIGLAWRTPSYFTAPGSAGDVVRFEREELGNDLPASADVMRDLDALPARALVWVARDKETAAGYYDGQGTERYTFAGTPRIVFEIPDGVLVIDREGA